MKKKLKLFGITCGFGLIVILVIFFFLKSLNLLFDDWLSQHIYTVLVWSSFALVLLLGFGIVSIRKVWKKQKEWL